MRHFFPMRIDAYIRISAYMREYSRKYARICALSALFRICRNRMAIPSANTVISYLFLQKLTFKYKLKVERLDLMMKVFGLNLSKVKFLLHIKTLTPTPTRF